jgi:FkbM family methyltransferase
MRATQKIITNLVLFYRNLPYKPFQGVLRHTYQKYLKSNEKNRTLIKEVNGINYELDLTEVIDAAIFYSDSREPATSKALAILCKPGDIVFDIGANVGSHSLPIAKTVGSTGKVYAFEPVPWALNKLHKNISLNAFNNIIVEPIALSDAPDDNAEFSLRASFKTTSQLPVNSDGNLNDNWWNACEKVKVKVETIDNFVLENNIEKVDLIKLDVDGFEAKVINGATKVLNKYEPVIIMELAPSWIAAKGDDVNAVINSLTSIGYCFYDEATFEKFSNILAKLADLKPGAGINVIASKKILNFI